MFPTPLPLNPFPESKLHTAHQRCLALEAAASDASQHFLSPVLCARLLGHLLRLAPIGNGQGHVQHEITLAVDDVKLMDLARFYLRHFICACKSQHLRCLGLVESSSGRARAPSAPPPSPSLEGTHQYPMAITAQGALDHRSARAAAGRRDNNCYMLTGKKNSQDGGFAIVETAYIIPEASVREEGWEQFDSAGVWTILSMFVDINILKELAGKLIHRPENIMSMEVTCRHYFDELSLWLKPVEGLPQTYHVCEARQGLKQYLGIPELVTFSTSN
ncbi:hypothetical protein EDC04DRAFT_1411286 [Pisolithus marmoratus]|nr:hypothetical protein EDC04DRAFT_1411286 [Pisolithus marmoratus]